jgi:hypothetical protein|nr:MAG TPA: hypothetical protein [Caudoviricetes sp.]
MIADALRTDYKDRSGYSQQNSNVPEIMDMNDPKSMDVLLKMTGGR